MYRRASEPGSAYCASVNAAGNDVSCSARWVAMCLLRVSRPSVYDRRIAWVVLNATRPEGHRVGDGPGDLRVVQADPLGHLPADMLGRKRGDDGGDIAGGAHPAFGPAQCSRSAQ